MEPIGVWFGRIMDGKSPQGVARLPGYAADWVVELCVGRNMTSGRGSALYTLAPPGSRKTRLACVLNPFPTRSS